MPEIIPADNQLPELLKMSNAHDIIKALNEAGVDGKLIAETLKDLILTAYTSTPKGELIPDNDAKLKAIELIMKMMKKWPDVAIQINNNWQGKEF